MNHGDVRKDRTALSWLTAICGLLLAAFSSSALACEEHWGTNEPSGDHYLHAFCPTTQDAWEACKSFATARGWGAEACGTSSTAPTYTVGWMREAGAGPGAPHFLGGFFLAPSPPPNPAKNAGPPNCPGQCFGDPINAGNGNKFETKLEYRGEGTFPLWFEWTYNFLPWESVPGKYRPLGFKRTFNYGSRLTKVMWSLRYLDVLQPAIVISRPDGKEEVFRKRESLNRWVGPRDSGSRLFELADSAGWRFEPENGYVELFDADGKLIEVQDGEGHWQRVSYDANGQLAEVVDMQGRALKFEHNPAGRIARVLLPEGGALTLAYTNSDQYLGKVEYRDNSAIEYRYDEADYRVGGYTSGALTGVLDEDKVRYSSTYYNQDLAFRTHLAGSLDDYTATYSTRDYQVTYAQVGLPSGATRKLNVAWINGRILPSRIVTTCPDCAERSVEYTYDANSREDLVTRNGVATDYDYDDRGLLAQQIEAKTDTAGNKRTTQTDWHPDFRAPLAQRIYDAAGTLVANATWTYNARGQELTYTRLDSAGSAPARTRATTYCEQVNVDAGHCPIVGLPTLIDGPRTDIADTVRYTYYATDDSGCAAGPATCGHRKGDLWKVTNALGQVVLETKRFDGAGRLQSSTDGNGVTTDYEHHPRGWLTAIKVRGADDASDADDRITRIAYRPTGLVERITLPDGEYLRYSYDTAHRLTDVIDQAGNTLHYTLNSSGDRLQEDVKTASGTLKRTMSRVYNLYGELSAIKDAGNNATGLTYDGFGDPDRTTDALGRVTDMDHDPLRRLVRSMQDAGGLNAQTDVQYNARDQITQVTDPNRLATFYRYNGFGDQIQLESPDTGITDYGYDAAGLLATKKDANDATAHRYTYDALNRPKAVFYTATGPADVEYDYDTVNSVCAAGETFAVGRVTAMRADGTELKYCYDRFRQVTRRVQTVGSRTLSLQYAYTLGGQLRGMTYPDGAVVDYIRDNQGRIQEIGVKPAGGVRTVLLNNATYEPFGPVSGWTYGNGRTLSRSYDLDYRPKSVFDSASGGLSLGYGYNKVGELTELKDGLQSTVQAKYDYDTLGRLTVTGDGITGTPLETYGYDQTGNRTSLSRGGVTDTYNYTTTSHHLSSIGAVSRSYDAAGNTISIGGTAKEFVYNANDRMKQVKLGGVVKMGYRYNARGEQVAAMNADNGPVTTYSLYDEGGQWIGDYDSAGAVAQQAIWMGNAPVGLLVGADVTQSLKYIQPDHLGTPRSVIDPARNIAIWTWDGRSEAFGNSSPNQDPDMDDVSLALNMRYPGQRYDAASELHYNYFRDYDPRTGRYVQSDPIGLLGGISTYIYGGGNPLGMIDPLGLKNYAACEVKQIMDRVREQMSGPMKQATWDALNNHSGLKDFEIGRLDYRIREPNSTFVYGGKKMSSAQFGNYVAGYAGWYYGGARGLAAVMWGGVAYDFDDDLRTRGSPQWQGDFDFDFDSRPDIEAGARRAIDEIENGLITCGCQK